MDLDARLIERWLPQDARPDIADERLQWSVPGGATGTLNIREFFASVWEDPE